MIRLLPIIMIILSVGAGAIYLWQGDIRHAVYWFAAAVLNVSVTF